MIIHDTTKGQVVFVYTPTAPVKKVSVVGDFNSWDAAARRMTRYPKDGTYRARVSLAPGRYEYKFVVDGEWYADAGADEVVPNPYGTTNSVLVVAAPGACECSGSATTE
jgi:1,4-alpha-glucan branching enzyme